jgi:hypothetical protein
MLMDHRECDEAVPETARERAVIVPCSASNGREWKALTEITAVRDEGALARTLAPLLSHPTRRSPPHKGMWIFSSIGGGRRSPATAAGQGAGR